MFSPKISALFHLIAFIVFGWAEYYLEVHLSGLISRGPKGNFLGMWKYLTHWNLNLQLAYYGLCLICDLLGKANKKKRDSKLAQFRDTIFHGLAFPTAWYVALTFWTIYAFDRELILPKSMDKIYPPWLNHSSHTLVASFIFIESFLSYHKEPSKATGLGLIFALFLAYGGFTLYVALVLDYWIYPVMEFLSWPGRLGMVIGGFPFAFTLYFVGIYLHHNFWPQRRLRKLQGAKNK